MAVTKGHGNPNWTEDETILALDLYFDLDGKIPSGADDAVVALSQLLRSFPYHALAARKESFRNPDGVAFKLQNLRQIATGKGLGNTSRTDKHVWDTFGHDPKATKARAQLIRQAISLDPAAYNGDSSDDDVTFAEGRSATDAHKRRERNPKLRRNLIDLRKKANALCCEVCGYKNYSSDARFDEAGFEAHHLKPLAFIGETQTKLSDLALLCATCHRLAHRAIALEKRWLTLAELKQVLPTAN